MLSVKQDGEKTHTLSIAEMPSHKLALNTNINCTGFGSQNSLVRGSGGTTEWKDNESYIKPIGGNQAHNNMPPNVVTNFIIKAEQVSMTAAKVIDNLNPASSLDALSANQGKYLNETKLNFGYSAKVSNTSIPANKLRFTVLEVSGIGDFNIKLSDYYTSINGQVITSFVIGQINTQDNVNVTSIVPTINRTNYYNYISELRVFSNAKSATTYVHIGVFYVPND